MLLGTFWCVFNGTCESAAEHTIIPLSWNIYCCAVPKIYHWGSPSAIFIIDLVLDLNPMLACSMERMHTNRIFPKFTLISNLTLCSIEADFLPSSIQHIPKCWKHKSAVTWIYHVVHSKYHVSLSLNAFLRWRSFSNCITKEVKSNFWY